MKEEIVTIKQLMIDITNLRDRLSSDWLKEYCDNAIKELKELADTISDWKD